MMEQLQISYIRAISAAAGCIMDTPDIDDGIDVVLKHKSESHTAIPERVARLEIQLKATAGPMNNNGSISITMRHDRWDYFRTKDPALPKIVVIMLIPERQEHWTFARPKALSIHYAGYWVNIADSADSDADRPTVKASGRQLFDDIALCDMMERIGRGEAP